MPSANTPTPPTGVPPLYSGKPPGSADRPSGVRIGPTLAVAAIEATLRDPSKDSELNCTPQSGPLEREHSRRIEMLLHDLARRARGERVAFA